MLDETNPIDTNIPQLPAALATAAEPPRQAIGHTPAPPPLTKAETKRLWFEVAVVMALTWFPFLTSALGSILWPMEGSVAPLNYDMLNQMALAVQVIVPVLFIIWRTGGHWGDFGIKHPRPLIDLSLTAAILIAHTIVYFMYWAIMAPLYWIMESGSDVTQQDVFAYPKAPPDYVILTIGCLCIGAYEELTMRGFLIPSLERLTGSTAKAVAYSSIIFASYHLYQPAVMVGNVLLVGVIFGIAFCIIRRIWPLILAHAVMDILAFSFPEW